MDISYSISYIYIYIHLRINVSLQTKNILCVFTKIYYSCSFFKHLKIILAPQLNTESAKILSTKINPLKLIKSVTRIFLTHHNRNIFEGHINRLFLITSQVSRDTKPEFVYHYRKLTKLRFKTRLKIFENIIVVKKNQFFSTIKIENILV